MARAWSSVPRIWTASNCNRAYSLYVRQNAADQGKLLEMVLSNCTTDGVNLYPAYRKPFDLIFERAKTEEWRARRDSNLSRFAGVNESRQVTSGSPQAKS